MLVLERRPGEAIVIRTRDGDVVVRLGTPRGARQRLLVEAPAEIVVMREELVAAEPSP